MLTAFCSNKDFVPLSRLRREINGIARENENRKKKDESSFASTLQLIMVGEKKIITHL